VRPRIGRLLALLLAGTATACSHSRPAVTSAAADTIRALERLRLRALVSADTATASRLTAADFQLINPVGMTLTKQEYLAQVAAGTLDYLRWDPEEIVVRHYGNAAVIRYRSQLEVTVAGQHNPARAHWHTDLYERRGGSWQVVWSQATFAR
jgi:hypothetical protein